MAWIQLEVLLGQITLYEQTFIRLFSAQSTEERINLTSFDAGRMIRAVIPFIPTDFSTDIMKLVVLFSLSKLSYGEMNGSLEKLQKNIF